MVAVLLALLQVASLLLIARAILSWFRPEFGTTLYRVTQSVNRVTDPVVIPVRRVLPRFGSFDFSVLVLLLGINLVLVPVVASL